MPFGSSYTRNGAFRLESGLGKGIKPLDGLPEIDRTYFVVIKCETGPGNDRFSLFLDPDPGGSEPAVPLIVKSDTEVGRLNKIHLSSYLPHASRRNSFRQNVGQRNPRYPYSDVGRGAITGGEFYDPRGQSGHPAVRTLRRLRPLGRRMEPNEQV